MNSVSQGVDIFDIIRQTKQAGIKLSAVDGQISLSRKKGTIVSSELMELIKNNKEDILTYFQTTGESGEAISKQTGSSSIPLSFAQEQLWLIDNIQGSSQYHLPALLSVKGAFDFERASRSFQTIVRRHEALRTVIRSKGEELFQYIMDASGFNIEYIQSSDDQNITKFIEEEVSRPFDLADDYMLRVTILKKRNSECLLLLVMHHIAADGWSLPILVNEFKTFYHHGDEAESLVPNLSIQYKDFSIWQHKTLNDDVLKQEIYFWEEHLRGVEPLELSTDHARPARQGNAGESLHFILDQSIADGLKEIAKSSQTTLYTVLFGVYQLFLNKYSSQTHFAIGTPSANRDRKELTHLIGYFVNTLAIHIPIEPNRSFVSQLQEVKQGLIKVFAHQDVPFEKVVQRVEKQRDLARSPIFQTMLSLQIEAAQSEFEFEDFSLAAEPFKYPISKFDLTFDFTTAEDGTLHARIEFSTELFKSGTIRRMFAHFRQLCQQVIANPNLALVDYELIEPEEERWLKKAAGGQEINFGKETVLQLIDKWTKLSPNAVAIQCEGESLTYQDVMRRSNQVANSLIREGVMEGMIVPIALERNTDLITSILGIWKAGACYVPIDWTTPEVRLERILKDIDPPFVLTQSALVGSLSDAVKGKLLILEELSISSETPEVPDVKVDSQELAYVIYTSGTTGMPKGVMIEHQSLSNFLQGFSKALNLDDEFSILSVTNYTFDISILEFFLPLTLGGKMMLATMAQTDDMEELIAILDEFKPSHMQATPSFWHMLTDAGWTNASCTKVITGGEPIGEKLKQKLVELSAEQCIWGVYGPTEATIWASYSEMNIHSPITLGQPLANVQMHVLNDELQLQPVGVPGEIYIGGQQLARGYFKRAELSFNRFIPDPLQTGMYMYKTGDIGKRLPDGTIAFMGRNDDQVKIRGNRIELGEIVNELEKLEYVEQAALVVNEPNTTNASLWAYVVTNQELSPSAIEQQLQKTLPSYMIPRHYKFLDRFPLNPNGKVDKKALPPIDKSTTSSAISVQPKSDLEKKIHKEWMQVLNITELGIHDNFFAMGGHSVLAVKLVMKLKKVIGAELKLHHVFEHQTIVELASFIERTAVDQVSAIQRYDSSDRIAASYMQERLWFIDQLEGSVHYHIPAAFKFKGELDIDLFKTCIEKIVERHESLRTVFELDGGKVYQKVRSGDGFHVDITGLSDIGGKDNLNEYIAQEFNKPFDLAKDYKVRLTIVRATEHEYYILLVLHHIASDGWSLSLMVSELNQLYQGEEPLPQLSVQYSDFSIWQKTILAPKLESQLAYWKQKLAGTSPLEIPIDLERPPVQSSAGDTIEFSISQDQKLALERLCSDQGVTLFTTILSIYQVLLHRHSSSKDICVGIPVANRGPSETADLIGFFVNTLVIRSNVDGNLSFLEFLATVNATVQESLKYQDVPFEKIVNEVVKERDASRTPLFQTMLSYQAMDDLPKIELGDGSVELLTQHNGTAKFDLEVEVVEFADEIKLRFEYCSDLFKSATIHRLSQHFLALVNAVLHAPDESIGSFPMLSDSESQWLFEDFNPIYDAYANDLTVLDLFHEQVSVHPNRLALKHGNRCYSYRELDEHSNRLTHYLLSEVEIQADDLVLIIMDRSDQFLAAILSIWKAGGAYVPVDPDLPNERVAEIIQQCEPKGAFVEDKYLTESLNTLLIDHQVQNFEFPSDLSSFPKEAIKRTVDPSSLSYIIFTSGSTGKPKGAMIEHRGMINHLLAKKEDLKLSRQSIVAQNASQSFDISVWQFFVALISGGQTCVYGNDLIYNPREFVRKLGDDQVNILEVVPSYLIVLLDMLEKEPDLVQELSGLQYLMVTGETLHAQLVDRWFQWFADIPMVNAYGPTEASDDITHHMLTEPVSGLVPIGKPVRNMNIYVLNEQLSMAGINIKGELYTSGVGVGRGYIQNPEKTGMSFFTDPFRPELRMYKTGDIARITEDGSVEFFGRNDHQIKLRGFRIELQEIESVLISASPFITNAIALVKQVNNQEVLTAFYSEMQTVEEELVLHKLKSRLPHYMVPEVLIPMKEMPLTPNGKVDRKSLAGHAVDVKVNLERPQNETEEELVQIWAAILGVDSNSIGVNVSFFEIGGSSIIAFQLINGIEERFKKQVSIQQIFSCPTIRELSRLVQAQDEELSDPILKSPEKEIYHTSFAQERIFYHFLSHPDSTIYNISGGLKIAADTDQKLLLHAIQKLLERHTALRTSFVMTENGLFQKVNEVPDIDLKNLSGFSDVDKAFEAFVQPHDLEMQASMIHFGWYAPSETEALLFIDLHHIICDGLSLRILESDLRKILAGENLPSKEINYIDYAEWQRSGDQRFEDQLTYWQEKLSGAISTVKLSQRSGTSHQDYDADNTVARFSEKETKEIDRLIRSENITPFMFFIGIFYVFLQKMTGQNDLIIGSDVIGRTHRSIRSVVGTFVNILPFRVELDEQWTISKFLKVIKETVLEGFQNQDIQFDQMVKMVEATSASEENPLAQVHFAYLDFDQEEEAQQLETFSAVQFLQKVTTNYEFKIEVSRVKGAYQVDWIYRKSLLDQEEISIFQQYYMAIVSHVLSNMDVTIGEIQP